MMCALWRPLVESISRCHGGVKEATVLSSVSTHAVRGRRWQRRAVTLYAVTTGSCSRADWFFMYSGPAAHVAFNPPGIVDACPLSDFLHASPATADARPGFT
jgi:hypothetical protein